MPFFDFKCQDCGHVFNLRISNEEKAKVRCEKCGQNRVAQMISPFFSAGGKTPSQSTSGGSPNCGGCGYAGSG